MDKELDTKRHLRSTRHNRRASRIVPLRSARGREGLALLPSLLNYIGGKFRLLPQILPHFPGQLDTFVDLFCGGCNVGLNVSAEAVLFADSNPQLIRLCQTFQTMRPDSVFERVRAIIKDYGLSESSEHSYAHYGCDSSDGLGAANRDAFLRLREAYNQSDRSDYISLFILLVYAFNNQIRFNSRGEFNLPVGKRDFNGKMQRKLGAFLDRLHSGTYSFLRQDFRDFDPSSLTERSLVYCDPPYLLTCAPYNEQGGWREEDELDLFAFLDSLSRKGVRFALSNVLSCKGERNPLLAAWAKNYRVIPLDYNYRNANYQRRDRTKSTEEVLVLNY